MSDFLPWLHAHYIRPQLDAAPKRDYAFHFDLIRSDLPPAGRESLDKVLEFTAIQAFLLGLRTGEGLSHL